MPSPLRFPELLRRADQAAVAGLLVLGATAVIIWLAVQSGMRRRMIEVDRPEPKTAQFQVDINTAECPELIQLPGIGNELARRIVENRRAYGRFRTIEDLRRVPGIGPKTFEKLRHYLCPLPDAGNLAANKRD